MIFDEYNEGCARRQSTSINAVETMSEGARWPDQGLSTGDPVPEGLSIPAAPPRPATNGGPRRIFGATGYSIEGPFLAFYEHYGPTLCGEPISGELIVDGRRSQFFQRLALEEVAPGRVRPRTLGEDWLALARAVGQRDASNGQFTAGPRQALVDVSNSLASEGAYPRRTLSEIRYLVIHHTGAAPEVSPGEIATEHVEAMGWPGIGYHFIVAEDGTVWRTQDLTAVSHHARQFNPAAVGIALAGNFMHGEPPAYQLKSVAALLADLLDQLGLSPDAVRGHGELVSTNCPGDTFLSSWKERLMTEVRRTIGARTHAGTW